MPKKSSSPARQRQMQKDRTEFLGIDISPKSSKHDLKTAVAKKTGSLNFSQYLAANDLQAEWNAFRKAKRTARCEKTAAAPPQQLPNIANRSFEKCDGKFYKRMQAASC
jgi:hypothetical protein